VEVRAGGVTVASEGASLELGWDEKVRSEEKFLDLFAVREVVSVTAMRRKTAFASVAAGILGTQVLNNFGATTEMGEPHHGGEIGGASRWFRSSKRITPALAMVLRPFHSDAWPVGKPAIRQVENLRYEAACRRSDAIAGGGARPATLASALS